MGGKETIAIVFSIYANGGALDVPKAVSSTMESPYGAGVPYAGFPHGEPSAVAAAVCLFLMVARRYRDASGIWRSYGSETL